MESKPSERKKRVGISGSYGGLNLGDEAILTAIIAQLRSIAAGRDHGFFTRCGKYARSTTTSTMSFRPGS
jgi:hypothetical protein